VPSAAGYHTSTRGPLASCKVVTPTGKGPRSAYSVTANAGSGGGCVVVVVASVVVLVVAGAAVTAGDVVTGADWVSSSPQAAAVSASAAAARKEGRVRDMVGESSRSWTVAPTCAGAKVRHLLRNFGSNVWRLGRVA
jgi:hypothetical protein